MRRHCSLSLAALALLIAAAAVPAPGQAQGQPPRPAQPQPPVRGPQPSVPAPQQQQVAPKPYKPIAVREPAAVSDPSFEAFRKQLADIAARKDRAALARLVVAQGFFWQGEKGDRADKRKPGIDNLAAAISLAAKDGSGWEALAGFASEPTGMPFPQRTGVICAPAEPDFDAKELDDLAKATGTEESDWGYPIQPNLEVRAAPQPNAPVIEKLGLHFVWVVQDESAANLPAPMLRVVTPSGKTGFVPVEALSPLGNDQICYLKDGSGWKIAGFIGDDQ